MHFSVTSGKLVIFIPETILQSQQEADLVLIKLAGYFENGEYLEGLSLFLLMREFGVYPNLGRALHGYVAKVEYGDDVSLLGIWGKPKKFSGGLSAN
nr:pentatricopeptide repeat-containing protein At1g15510, chloroplastic [Ipomoea batatas]